MLVRCEACDRPYVRKDPPPGRCPRCGATEPVAAGEARVDAVVVEGGAPEGLLDHHRHRRGTIPVPPARFVDGRPAWERRDLPFPRRLFGTVADVLARPAAFFTHLSREGTPPGAPAAGAFAYLCLLVGHGALALWRILATPDFQGFLAQAEDAVRATGASPAEVKEGLAFLAALSDAALRAEPQYWLQLALAPFSAFFALHLFAGIVHLCAGAFRPPGHDDERVPYEVTYRFVIYAQAPMLLSVLPVVGGIAPAWTVVVVSLAMVKLYRLRFLGVVGAVVLPLLFVWTMWGTVLQSVAPAVASLLGVTLPPGPPSP